MVPNTFFRSFNLFSLVWFMTGSTIPFPPPTTQKQPMCWFGDRTAFLSHIFLRTIEGRHSIPNSPLKELNHWSLTDFAGGRQFGSTAILVREDQRLVFRVSPCDVYTWVPVTFYSSAASVYMMPIYTEVLTPHSDIRHGETHSLPTPTSENTCIGHCSSDTCLFSVLFCYSVTCICLHVDPLTSLSNKNTKNPKKIGFLGSLCNSEQLFEFKNKNSLSHFWHFGMSYAI